MFSRILLFFKGSTFPGSSFSCCKIKFGLRSITNRHIFLKMSVNSGSLSEKTCIKDTVYPPVFVISKIKNLSSAIKDLSHDVCHGLLVRDIDVPEDSDILSSSSIEALADAEIVVADAKMLSLNYKDIPKLKWAHSTWAGIEPLIENINEKPNFIVTRHSIEEFSDQIAEYVMGHILILEKNFRGMWAAQMEKSWSKMVKCIWEDHTPNRRLKELTIGVLGVGNMGQAIAKFFQPHGTKVIGLGRRIRKPEEFGLFHKIESSLANVLGVSDYIVNTLPSTAETVGLLNEDVLKACTKKPVFINVGRGTIINEDTLVKALENNWLSYAVLDVFQKEPLSTDSKLWNLNKQVIITPHYAAISLPSYVAKDFLSSLVCYQQNRPLKNVVDWEKGY